MLGNCIQIWWLLIIQYFSEVCQFISKFQRIFLTSFLTALFSHRLKSSVLDASVCFYKISLSAVHAFRLLALSKRGLMFFITMHMDSAYQGVKWMRLTIELVPHKLLTCLKECLRELIYNHLPCSIFALFWQELLSPEILTANPGLLRVVYQFLSNDHSCPSLLETFGLNSVSSLASSFTIAQK